ncbi:hypothetical protein IAU60_006324 [Kwoniella sp. DSM 27419]
MPYVPPGSDRVQPIAIPIERTHQLAEGSLVPFTERHQHQQPQPHLSRSHDDTLTPRLNGVTGQRRNTDAGMQGYSPFQPTHDSGAASSVDLDTINRSLASTSLAGSTTSTPPLEPYADGYDEGHSTKSLPRSSPATSSVISLPEQKEGQDPHARLDDEDDDEGRKVAGEPESPLGGQTVDAKEIPVIDPLGLASGDDAYALYKQGLYAYTHTLYIQAKLSNSRAERRRQSVSIHGQFGARQSGMEKMAAKKALARRLNG